MVLLESQRSHHTPSVPGETEARGHISGFSWNYHAPQKWEEKVFRGMSIAYSFCRGQDVTGYIGKLLQKERCCKCSRQQQKTTCVVLNWTLCTAQTSSAQVLQTLQHLGAAFCTRTIQKLFASCRQKCWQDWDPSLQQKHFSCRWKKSPALNPTEADGRSLMPGLWSRPCTAEKHDLLYLIFKTRWLMYISRPICVMAEIFHSVWPERSGPPNYFLCIETTLRRRLIICALRGNFYGSYFAVKQLQCTPPSSPYALLGCSALKSPSCSHKQ